MFVITHRALSIFTLLWAVSSVPFVTADGKCFKSKDGKDFCVDRMPVGANVLILIATIVIVGLGIALLICMRCCRGHSKRAPPDFLFDSEQMQGPPTIIEAHYNPASGQLTGVYESAKSPTFPERVKSPVFPERAKGPALPQRAQMKQSNRLSMPVSFVGMPMPQPMTAPADKASFGSLSVEGRPPSYEGDGGVSPSLYPVPPQTAFVSGHFDRPPQHPSIRRSQRKA